MSQIDWWLKLTDLNYPAVIIYQIDSFVLLYKCMVTTLLTVCRGALPVPQGSDYRLRRLPGILGEQN